MLLSCSIYWRCEKRHVQIEVKKTLKIRQLMNTNKNIRNLEISL